VRIAGYRSCDGPASFTRATTTIRFPRTAGAAVPPTDRGRKTGHQSSLRLQLGSPISNRQTFRRTPWHCVGPASLEDRDTADRECALLHRLAFGGEASRVQPADLIL